MSSYTAFFSRKSGLIFAAALNLFVLAVLFHILSLSPSTTINLPFIHHTSPSNALRPPSAPLSYAQALELASTSNTSSTLLSNAWVPLSLSECKFGTPHHFAPCVATRLDHVEYAEELLYPDFQIREPIFVNDEHRARWLSIADGIRERASITDGWLTYKSQTGQNFVFGNVSYRGKFDKWNDEACMSGGTTTSDIRPGRFDAGSKDSYDTVIVASSPDSWAFQHHLDRITHIVSQASHLTLNSSSVYALTGKQGNRFVQNLWTRLGFADDHLLHDNQASAVARHLIFSCRSVLVHPWLSLMTLEAFGIHHAKSSTGRKKIVYMTRNNGRASNGGRKVTNEDALLDSIRSHLDFRQQGEELVVFDETQYEDLDSLFSFFLAEVAVIIGPHGGGLMHHRWAAKGTLVIEFMPTSFTSMAIYEEASVLSQQYAVLVVEPTDGGGTNMFIEPTDVIGLLEGHLGKGGEVEDPLRKSYGWHAKELEVGYRRR